MKYLGFVIASSMLLSSSSLMAQPHHKMGMIENTTAPMSDKVIRQRLQALGYKNIRIDRTNTLKYQINAEKSGQPVVLDFHPQAGLIHETTPGHPAVKRWLLPLEPPKKSDVPKTYVPKKKITGRPAKPNL